MEKWSWSRKVVVIKKSGRDQEKCKRNIYLDIKKFDHENEKCREIKNWARLILILKSPSSVKKRRRDLQKLT